MLATHALSLVAMKVCTMGAGYSTSDAELPGFTLAAPIMNISPATDPRHPEESERNVRAVFDSVKERADRQLATLRRTFEAPLRQFLGGHHAYSRWTRLLAPQGGSCSAPLFVEDGEISIHFVDSAPAVVQAVVAVQVAAHLARTLPAPEPRPERWSPRAALVRELGNSLSAWPGTSVWELGQAAVLRDKVEALAAEPLAAKPGDEPCSDAMVEDRARTKAKVLVAYLRGQAVADDVLRAISRFRYEDMQALFVLVAGLASDSVWSAQKPTLAAAIGKARKRIQPATELVEIERHLLRSAATPR
jgi:hypothetical protein